MASNRAPAWVLEPALKRFALSGHELRTLMKLIDDEAHVTGTWLLIDGKRVKRKDRPNGYTRKELWGATVELGFGLMSHRSMNNARGSLRLPFKACVPFRATTPEIHAAWAQIVGQVAAAQRREHEAADRRAAREMGTFRRLVKGAFKQD